MPEFMGMNFLEAQHFAETTQRDFLAAGFQTGMRLVQHYEKSQVLIVPTDKTVFQVKFRVSVKANRALLVFRSENDALPAFKIDVGNIQMRQSVHAHSGKGKHIDPVLITQLGTAIPHHPHGLIGIGFLDGLIGADFMNSPDGAFEDIVFVLQPGKKTGKNAADIVNVAAAAPAGLLIVRHWRRSSVVICTMRLSRVCSSLAMVVW